MTTVIPSRLSDGELVAEVARLAGCEREATASLIAHLAELYGRRLHERAGYSSLFTYCTEVLRLSEHEAYDRMRAATGGPALPGGPRVARFRPRQPHHRPVARPSHDTQEPRGAVRRRVRQAKRQVRELLARRFPKPDVASTIRKLPAPRGVSVPAPTGTSATPAAVPIPWLGPDQQEAKAASQTVGSAGNVGRPPIPAPPRPLVQPLAPDRYRITFTASKETCAMLELAQDLLRNAIPSGDPAQIVARALALMVEDLVKRKYAVTGRPRPGRGQAEESRNIPAEVRRTVFIRDRGRCAFIRPDGQRCGERAFVECHHLIPYAAGGKPTVNNIALRCRAHNVYEAEVFYGPIRDSRAAADGGLGCRRTATRRSCSAASR